MSKIHLVPCCPGGYSSKFGVRYIRYRGVIEVGWGRGLCLGGGHSDRLIDLLTILFLDCPFTLLIPQVFLFRVYTSLLGFFSFREYLKILCKSFMHSTWSVLYNVHKVVV